MVISYLLLSVLSDKVGRRKLLLAGMLVSGISMLGLSFMDTVAGIAIFRFLVGCTIGIIMGGSLVLLVEVVIAKRRGVAIVGGELCYIFGLVYTTLFCMATFTSFDEGNWRFGL
jgi:MFS family permease